MLGIENIFAYGAKLTTQRIASFAKTMDLSSFGLPFGLSLCLVIGLPVGYEVFNKYLIVMVWYQARFMSKDTKAVATEE